MTTEAVENLVFYSATVIFLDGDGLGQEMVLVTFTARVSY